MKWEWMDDIASLLVPVTLAVAALFLFASPAKAEGPTQARGVLCDTVDEVEAFVALASTGTPAGEAVEAVNQAIGKPNACIFGHVVFEAMEEVKQLAVEALELTIVKLAIVAVQTPMGFMPLEMTQYMVVNTKHLHPARIGA